MMEETLMQDPTAARPETASRTDGERTRPMMDSPTARKGFQIIALFTLAIALIVAFVSANSIVSIWFEYRWVPVVRLVFALLVGAVAVWVVMRMNPKAR